VVTEIITITLPWARNVDSNALGDSQWSFEGPKPFFAGPENKLLQAAIVGIEKQPAQFSPILLYGPSGCGKSHLLRGLVGLLAEQNPDLKFLCATGSDFARQYGDMLRQESSVQPRKQFFSAECFVLEDLHELLHFPSMQQVLLHLLDELERSGAIVLTTCRENPMLLDGFSEELRSRLSSGLMVPVVLPEQGTREVLIQRIVERHSRTIGKAAINKLASAFPHGLMQLSGIVNQLMTRTNVKHIDSAVVDQLLESDENPVQVELRNIASLTAKYFRVKLAEIKGNSRRQSIVQARSVAMLLARQLTDESLKSIGKHFGGRDHTTVMHAVNKIEELMKRDFALREAINELKEIILSRSIK